MKRNKASNVIIEEIDTNRDGTIDKHEFRKWLSNTEGSASASYESSRSEIYLSDNTTNRFDRNKYTLNGTVAVDDHFISDTVIQTNSLEETDKYLERAVDIYKDPNPQIIRRATIESPVTYGQRVLVRYLQPPNLPPPGPLIIKQVRPPQTPAPEPLVIRQYSARPPSPPPLILRERPPIPPPQLSSETVTRYLPAMPVPPRSVVIERFPPLPEKPRDIIIERWIPYGPQPERRTIVEEAPPAITYPEPRNKIIIYEGIEPRIARQFEKVGVVEENPADYVAQYGSSLLDSETLIQMARNAGVYEDISPPAVSSSTYTNIRESTTDYDLSRVVRDKDATVVATNRGATALSRHLVSSLSLYLMSYVTSVPGEDEDKQYTSDNTVRRRGGMLFDFVECGLFPADYTPGMKLTRKFVRPTHFSFPPISMWSNRTAKYKENVVDGRIVSVTVKLIEDGLTIHSSTISENEYNRMHVYSSAPKLPWTDFIQVLKVFILGNNQERESNITSAFNILDQGRKGVYGRTVSLPDGLISSDELRAFLSILTDEYRVDLCVFLADTNDSGQISLSEFTRMVKSGLARDIICERI